MTIAESEAIPYQSLDLRGERLLVLAPHPDDEVIGCGGVLAQHLGDGRATRVVIVTDGSEAGDAAVREEESRRGLAIIGGATAEFLHFRDRQLQDHGGPLSEQLRTILRDFVPDLILVPSPVEMHPDHIALARTFCELIQNDETLFADLAVARVAFYEVSSPIRPNALVDITAVADVKYEAVAAHRSQRTYRDYVSYARGLNAYRAMTLAPEARFAEAYWVTPLPAIRTTPFSALRDAVGAPKPIEITAEPLPITVVVRTRNRPTLLTQAVDSIRSGGYPAEVVVVNDGGETVTVADANVIHHQKSRGRSEAMNIGVRAAKSKFIAFLDDDDLYYPEHLPVLANAARASQQHAAWYTDAISAFVRLGENGHLETHSRQRIFGQEFDRHQLLLDNYIPLPTLLVPRETFLDLGGFDRDFDLFEDWDFLIRLSQRGSFAHIPRLTCEIRHIEGAGSITLESPEGSERFREAKLQVWRKHAALIDNNTIANVLEAQKRRITTLRHEAVDVRGERNHVWNDVTRLEREKGQLIAEIQVLHQRVNQALMRAEHLEGANAEIRNALAEADADRHEKGVRMKDLQAAFDDLSAAFGESERTGAALHAEVARLQSLLDMIYRSRTWKLHTIVEKMKGRG